MRKQLNEFCLRMLFHSSDLLGTIVVLRRGQLHPPFTHFYNTQSKLKQHQWMMSPSQGITSPKSAGNNECLFTITKS